MKLSTPLIHLLIDWSVINHVSFRKRIKFDDQCSKQDKIKFNHKAEVNTYISYEEIFMII